MRPVNAPLSSTCSFVATSDRGVWKMPLPNSDRPLLQAEGVNLIVLRADINHSIHHRGRGRHIAASGVAPQLGPGTGVQCVHLVVLRTDDGGVYRIAGSTWDYREALRTKSEWASVVRHN